MKRLGVPTCSSHHSDIFLSVHRWMTEDRGGWWFEVTLLLLSVAKQNEALRFFRIFAATNMGVLSRYSFPKQCPSLGTLEKGVHEMILRMAKTLNPAMAAVLGLSNSSKPGNRSAGVVALKISTALSTKTTRSRSGYLKTISITFQITRRPKGPLVYRCFATSRRGWLKDKNLSPWGIPHSTSVAEYQPFFMDIPKGIHQLMHAYIYNIYIYICIQGGPSICSCCRWFPFGNWTKMLNVDKCWLNRGAPFGPP